MKNILVINTSLNNEHGNSNKLTELFTQRWQQVENIRVVEQNLTTLNLPHLSADEMQAWSIAPADRNQSQKDLANHSDQLIAELKLADHVILGMPMYNFGVPSTFKTWIDRVARAGITFSYTEQGPKGLLEGKKVTILAARGGMYAGTPKDSQSQYLKDVFAFLGLSDIEFIYAEGLAMGEDGAAKAWKSVEQRIEDILPKLAA
jgi:FMN-dependent NADH-azoreductase